MNYKQVSPHPSLKNHIKCYWWLDNNSTKNLNFTIFPDGRFDLLVSFKNYQPAKISLSGLWSKPVDVLIQPNTQLFGIQFKLLAVDDIFQKSIASIYNNIKMLNDDFWNLNIISFHNTDQLVKELNENLLSIIDNQKNSDERKVNLFRLLQKTKGNCTIENYAHQVFWSRRQMNRYFNDRFGLSLKTYCKILKCAASFKQIKKGEFYPEQNYFDRSHFIKELKLHTGTNPKELFKNKNDRFLQLSIIKEK